MNAQAGIIITLLAVLVALQIWTQWPGISGDRAQPAATPPPAFSVTQTGQGQYVMRANDNIFFCVSNRCTTIQLITGAAATGQSPAAAPAQAPAEP